MPRIIWAPDGNTIFGVQPEQDFSLGAISISPATTFKEVELGDAVYLVPNNAVLQAAVARGAECPPVWMSSELGLFQATELPFAELSDVPFPVPTPVQIGGSVATDATVGAALQDVLTFTVPRTTRKLSYSYDPFAPNKLPAPLNTVAESALSEGIGRPTVVSVDPSSLAFHVESNLAAMVAGRVSSAASNRLYSTITGSRTTPIADSTATRSTTHIAAGYNVESYSTFKFGEPPATFQGVLITPLHVWSSHVTIGAGSEICFVDSANVKHTRTVVSAVQDAGNWAIGRLNAPIFDVPVMKLAPIDIRDYLPAVRCYRRPLPVLAFGVNMPFVSNDGANGGVGIRYLCNLTDGAYTHVGYMQDEFSSWAWGLSSGDSNSPYCLPVNGELVLLGTEYFGTGGFAVYSDFSESTSGSLRSIEEWVDILGGGYQVQRADLSMFPKYP